MGTPGTKAVSRHLPGSQLVLSPLRMVQTCLDLGSSIQTALHASEPASMSRGEGEGFFVPVHYSEMCLSSLTAPPGLHHQQVWMAQWELHKLLKKHSESAHDGAQARVYFHGHRQGLSEACHGHAGSTSHWGKAGLWQAGSSHLFKVTIAAGSTRDPASLHPAFGRPCCPEVLRKQVGDGQGSVWDQ